MLGEPRLLNAKRVTLRVHYFDDRDDPGGFARIKFRLHSLGEWYEWRLVASYPAVPIVDTVLSSGYASCHSDAPSTTFPLFTA